MKKRFDECALCAKYNLAICPHAGETQPEAPKGPEIPNRIIPILEGRGFFLSSLPPTPVEFSPTKSFEDYIELVNKALHYKGEFPRNEEDDCIVRGIALDFENHNQIVTYLGCALELLLKQPRVSSYKSQIIYDALCGMVTRFTFEKEADRSTVNAFSWPSFSLNNPFRSLYGAFVTTLTNWVEYSSKQASIDRKTAQNWYDFTPLLLRVSSLFSVEIPTTAFLTRMTPEREEDVTHKRVELVKPERRQNPRLSFIENAYVIPCLSKGKEVSETLSRLTNICKNFADVDKQVSLDFLNSLATSVFLLDKVMTEPFEISDKTYVLSNAFKSIEELITCSLILIDKVSSSPLPVYVSCFDGGSSVNFNISDYSNWLAKATLGNLSYTVRYISKFAKCDDDIFDDIQWWTKTQRNGFFHKHGLLYESLEETFLGDEANNIPPLASYLDSTTDLAAKIILWTHEVCKKIADPRPL